VTKVSKASVDYGPGHPNGDHCGVCRHFEVEAPEHCEIVEGRILASMWCKRFAKKSRLNYRHRRAAPE
jgi:hypothetical protein